MNKIDLMFVLEFRVQWGRSIIIKMVYYILRDRSYSGSCGYIGQDYFIQIGGSVVCIEFWRRSMSQLEEEKMFGRGKGGYVGSIGRSFVGKIQVKELVVGKQREMEQRVKLGLDYLLSVFCVLGFILGVFIFMMVL